MPPSYLHFGNCCGNVLNNFLLQTLIMASGIVSSHSFALMNMMISLLVGRMGLVATLPERCFSTSPRIYGLPVRNIQAPGEFWRIWLSKSRSFTRCSGRHSSRASIHINVHREDEISCRNPTITESCSLWPPMAFPRSRKTLTILSGTSFSPPTTCFSIELRTTAGDCSS